MNESAPVQYRFVGRATGSDPNGYYYERWDLAQKVSVIATNQGEATQKARQMLGFHPRFGQPHRNVSGWAVQWKRIEEVAS